MCALATLLLVHWSVTRHVLTLSLVLTAVAALGVMYPGPVLLLLQPGLAGLLLAVLFAGLQALLTRRRHQTVITLASTIVPGHSSVRPLAAGVGSNDFTRSQVPVADAVAVSLESGSRP